MSVFRNLVRYLVIKSDKTIFMRLCTKRNYSGLSTKSRNNYVNEFARACHVALNSSEFYSRVAIHTVSDVVDAQEKEEVEYEMSRRTENDFARKLFEESMRYKKTIMEPFRAKMTISDEEAQQLLSADYSQMKPSELLSFVKKLSYHALDEPINVKCDDYTNILQALVNCCNTFSNSELIELIRHLIPLRTLVQTHGLFVKLCKVLDTVCKSHLKGFTRNETFVLCDMFSRLYEEKIASSHFMWYAVLKLGSKPSKLTPENVVQLCYFINLCRKTPINMYELECCVEAFLDDISIDELGVIAMGFFKTKNRIRNTVVSQGIMQKVMKNVDNIDSVSLGSIMKLFRYSANITESTMFRMLLKTLEPHIPKYNLMTTIHIAHACITLMVPETDVLAAILDKFQRELKNARLKDMERMVYIMSTFNYEPHHPLYHNIIEEIRLSHRKAEIIKYKRVLPWLLQYLAYVNIYPLDLIRTVLDENYIKQIYRNHNFYVLTREFIVLDYGLKIDVPEYDGPFLNQNIKNYLVQKHSILSDLSKRKSSKLDRLIADVLHTGKEVFGTDTKLYSTQILPHVQSEQIIIAIDSNNNVVPAKPLLSSFPTDAIKYVNCGGLENTKFIAVAIMPSNLVFRGTQQITGLMVMQLRHLKALGYIPFTLFQSQWETLHKTYEKQEFFKTILGKAINF